MRAVVAQVFARWADIDVAGGVVGERLDAEASGAVVHIRARDVRPDALGFDHDQVLVGAVLAVPCDVPRSQAPAEACVPEQVEHRLVVHHLGGRHQHRQDDARLAAVDDDA
jgi:hypothetical protein